MTNNEDLKIKLKSAAEIIGSEKWHTEACNVWSDEYEVNGERSSDLICCCENVNNESIHADFIATASPANILSLLAESDALRQQVSDLEESKTNLATLYDMNLCDMLVGSQYMDPPDGEQVEPLEQVARMVEDYRQRIAELEVEAKELIGFKELMAKAAKALNDGEPLNLEALFKGELASSMFAIMFAGEFKRSGATNFLELLYEVPEFGELTVTLQKVEGKTPGQRIAELEAYVEVEALGADKAAEECVYWMKRCKELEDRMVGAKLAEPIIDAICLMAAEIHNLGRGVSDERAQEIINSMRLAAGSKLEVGE